MNFGVVLVTYNRLDKLKISLECYEKQTYLPKWMIVVNNASNDGTKEYLNEWLKKKSRIKKEVVHLDKNTGGSGGFYEGLRRVMKTKIDYVWVSDDDAFPQDNCFAIANDYIRKNTEKDISAICGTVLNRGKIDLFHRRRLRKGLLFIFQSLVSKREYKKDVFELNLFTYVGTFININKMKKVGLPEKNYFIYYDDTEHSYRLSLVGKILCIPSIKIIHDGPINNSRDGITWKLYYGIRNSIDFVKRHFSKRYCYSYKLYCRFKYYTLTTLLWRNKLEGYRLINYAIKSSKNENLGLDFKYKPGWKVISSKDNKNKKSIARNYIYNLMYQLLTIFLPLITTPYLSRVLGASQIGIYGYTVSIVTYFILFGSLGASMYGQREIAYYQEDKRKRSKAFWEIVIIRAISLFISLLLFYFIYASGDVYSLYYKILLIQLIANIFDISWLFQGIEEFDKTVIRNFIVKLLCLVLIFAFVKDSSDLWIYFLIYAGAELIGNLSIWFYLFKYIEKIKFSTLNFKRHLKPIFALLIPQIAIQIYTVLDKTMIGFITDDMAEVGFYEQAQKVVKAALMIISALQIVMNSRIANAYAEKNEEEIKRCLEKSFQFVWFLSIPMMFGFIAIAENFVPWYYGSGYSRVTNILIATAPILIAIGLNGVTGIQYLVQVGKEKVFTKSVILGSIVNIIFNIILIENYGGVGAAVASVISETSIFLFQLKYLKNKFNILHIFKLSWKCFFSGMVMFCSIKLLSNYLSVSIINTFLQIMIGMIIYFCCLLLLKYQFLKDLILQVFHAVMGILKIRRSSEFDAGN